MLDPGPVGTGGLTSTAGHKNRKPPACLDGYNRGPIQWRIAMSLPQIAAVSSLLQKVDAETNPGVGDEAVAEAGLEPSEPAPPSQALPPSAEASTTSLSA